MMKRTFAKRGTGALAILLLGAMTGCGSPVGSERLAILRDGRVVAFNHMPAEAALGQRVLFIHGAPADASSWDRLLREQRSLLRDCETIAIDRLGYGDSADARSHELTEHARSIEPFLQEGMVLVGHSYGASVALRAAAAYPERVGGVVVIASAGDPAANGARLVAGLGERTADASHAAVRELTAFAGASETARSALAEVVCPVVVIHGASDPIAPHDEAIAYLQSSLVAAADVRVVSVLGAGHDVHRTHTRTVAEEIADLAGAVAPPRGPERARDEIRRRLPRPRSITRPADFSTPKEGRTCDAHDPDDGGGDGDGDVQRERPGSEPAGGR